MKWGLYSFTACTSPLLANPHRCLSLSYSEPPPPTHLSCVNSPPSPPSSRASRAWNWHAAAMHADSFCHQSTLALLMPLLQFRLPRWLRTRMSRLPQNGNGSIPHPQLSEQERGRVWGGGDCHRIVWTLLGPIHCLKVECGASVSL